MKDREGEVRSTLSRWLDVEEDKIKTSLVSNETAHFRFLFKVPEKPFVYRKLMRAMSWLILKTPYNSRYNATTHLKEFRRLVCKSSKPSLSLCNSERVVELGNWIGSKPKWNNKKFVVCMTHDIDYRGCYEFAPELLELDESHGIKSCWNFLADGPYTVDKRVLDRLEDNGHEIGLHGLEHDIAFGFRDHATIRECIKSSLSKLGITPRGFRAPALSYSRELLEVLHELGFSYDSSIPDRDLGLCYPYRIPGKRLWEIPVTTPQDSELIRDWNLSQDEAFKLLKSKIETIKRLHGVAVLLFHPCIIKKNVRLYEQLLEHINSLSDCWVTTPKELICHLEKRR